MSAAHARNHKGNYGQGGGQKKSVIDAPYNFVPLARWVWRPEWAPQVSHDVPFRDGLCGTLELKITACTPLLCGAAPQPASADKPGQVHFVQTTRDGKPAYLIPGSSLKGMTREALEILAYGRMRALDDRRFALRDISNSKRVPYGNAVRGVRAGFLKRDETTRRPCLAPCEFVWLPHKALREYLGFNGRVLFDKDECKAVAAKYATWQRQCKQAKRPADTILFDKEDEEFDMFDGQKGHRLIAVELGTGPIEGTPVFTGQVSNEDAVNFKGKPTGKKRDFVFYNRGRQAYTLTAQEWADFRFVHGEDGDDQAMSWPGYWKRQYQAGKRVPVFWLERGSGSHKRKVLGLAYMPRLAGDWSTHDLVEVVSPEHLKLPQNPAAADYDLAELMFGTLGESQEGSVASRVVFEPAFAQTHPAEENSPETVLNSPKPSYFPNYLQQKASLGDREPYNTYVDFTGRGEPPTMRGRKRYPVRGPDQTHFTSPPPPPDRHAATNYAVCVMLHPLPKGTVFTARVSFHNLRPVELGALIWALTLNGDGGDDHRHALGMGKPFGYGQLTVSIAAQDLECNDGQTPAAPAEYATRFAKAMDEVCRQNGEGAAWRQTAAVQLFLGMSDPKQAVAAGPGLAGGFPGKLKHMVLKPGRDNEFVQAKQQGVSLQPYLKGVNLSGTGRAVGSRVTPAAHRPVAVVTSGIERCDNALLTLDAGRGVMEVQATVGGVAVSPALTREALAAEPEGKKVLDRWDSLNRKARKRGVPVSVEIQWNGNLYTVVVSSIRLR